jgi:hypothetical protein
VYPSKKKDQPEISASEIQRLLPDYFPTLIFPNQNKFFIGRRRYFILKQDRWTIKVDEMSKIKDKRIAYLFPQREPHWDETEARRKYGNADIIRFFIDEINAYYYSEFSKMKQNKSVCINENTIPDMFLKKINYYDKDKKRNIIKEEWALSKMVAHLLRHKNPPSIYEVFQYYAHKQYTLLIFALNNAFDNNVPNNYEIDHLLNTGLNVATDAILKKYPKASEVEENRPSNPQTNKQRRQNSYSRKLHKLINEELESVPKDSNKYAPIELNIFIEKFRYRIPDIYRINNKEDYDKDDDKYDPFTKSDKKTIKNHIKRIKKYVNDPKYLAELQTLSVAEGRFREKIRLLYRLSWEQSVIEKYSKRGKLDKIQELYYKQDPNAPFDETMLVEET